MMSNLFLGRDAFIDFSTSVTGIILIIPAFFWLFFYDCKNIVFTGSKKDKYFITTKCLFWLSLIIVVLLIAPGSSLLLQKLINPHSYISIMISVPTALIVIYTFLHLTEYMRLIGSKKRDAVICLTILLIICNSIPITYDHPLGFELVSNSLKISPEVQEICDLVGSKYVLLPKEIYGQVHEYDSNVKADMLDEMNNNYNYATYVAKTAELSQAVYYVIKKNYDDTTVSELYPFTKTAETKHYVIYQRSE